MCVEVLMTEEHAKRLAKMEEQLMKRDAELSALLEQAMAEFEDAAHQQIFERRNLTVQRFLEQLRTKAREAAHLREITVTSELDFSFGVPVIHVSNTGEFSLQLSLIYRENWIPADQAISPPFKQIIREMICDQRLSINFDPLPK